MTEEIADELYTYLIIRSSISRIFVGCVNIGTKQWWIDAEWKKQAFTILKKASDPDIRTYGTADTTQMGERLLGEYWKNTLHT